MLTDNPINQFCHENVSSLAGRDGQEVGREDAKTKSTPPHTNKITTKIKGGLSALGNKETAQRVMIKAIRRKSALKLERWLLLDWVSIRLNNFQKRPVRVLLGIGPRVE